MRRKFVLSTYVATTYDEKIILFGMKLYLKNSKDFSWNGRYYLYNRSTQEKRKKKMTIGNILSVEYGTGEKFVGRVVSFKYMPGERLLFTMEIENVGFRSMYLDKCKVCDYIGFAN